MVTERIGMDMKNPLTANRKLGNFLTSGGILHRISKTFKGGKL